MSSTLTVVIAGDLCMRAPLDTLISSENELDKLSGGIRHILGETDFRLVNLENPLIDEGKPIPKSGPNLKGREVGIELLKSAKFDAIILANNHIGDYGSEGVFRTLSVLDLHGIGHTGAGMTLDDARKPWIAQKNGRTLAVLAAAENEFGTAAQGKPGSNGFNLRRQCADIALAKEHADYVIVVMHGGNECNPLPAPVVVDRYRTLIDAGADAVIGMHPHCPQGYEFYRNRPIVYSTGNFLFGNTEITDQYNPWYYGYLPRIVFGGENPELTVIPYRFSLDGRQITVLAGEERMRMIEYLKHLSELTANRGRLEDLYESWCVLRGREFSESLQYRITDQTDMTADKVMLGLRNTFTCEAHNDLMKTYLKILCDGRLEECSRGIPEIQALQKMPG